MNKRDIGINWGKCEMRLEFLNFLKENYLRFVIQTH